MPDLNPLRRPHPLNESSVLFGAPHPCVAHESLWGLRPRKGLQPAL